MCLPFLPLAYEEWEEQCELLDEKIEEIEDLIEG